MDQFFEYENICRACLNSIQNEKIALFDETQLLNGFQLHEILKECTSVQIYFSENISNCLCEECFHILEMSYKFRIQCLMSDQKLKDFLQLHKPELNLSDDKISCHNVINSDSIERRVKNKIKSEINDDLCNESKVCDEDNIINQRIHVKSETNCTDNYCIKSNTNVAVINDLENIIKTETSENNCNSQEFNESSDDNDIDNLETTDVDKPLSFKCRICADYFPSKSAYIDHIRQVHEQTIYECSECNKVYLTPWHLEKHKLIHGFNCKVCFENFDTESELKKHSKKHSKHGKFVCKDCGKEFNKKYNLSLHSRVHTGEKPYLCPVCGKAFADKGNLKTHARTHDGKKPYQCKVCDSKFSQLAVLKSHLITHSNEKNYTCAYCGKKLARHFSLQRHLLTHTDERKYHCSICTKSFRGSYERNRHMKLHTGEKDFKCLECGKEFYRSYNLVAHKKIHTGEKPHVCSICGRGFTQFHVLNSHLQTHKN